LITIGAPGTQVICSTGRIAAYCQPEIGAAKIIVMARPSTKKMATCPERGAVSGRIHSRYRRRLIDLPAHGRIVKINVETRRFRCVGTGCQRRICSAPR
jgi:transposase